VPGGQLNCLSWGAGGEGLGFRCFRGWGGLGEGVLHLGLEVGGVHGEGGGVEVFNEGRSGDGVGEEVGGLADEAGRGAVALDEHQVAVQSGGVRLGPKNESKRWGMACKVLRDDQEGRGWAYMAESSLSSVGSSKEMVRPELHRCSMTTAMR
jgi:hypothetical protein